MAVLFDSTKQITAWLVERGLNHEEIKSGMQLLLGDDWEAIDLLELLKRLRAQGYRLTETMPAFADEMEGLVRGVLKMDSFRRTIYGLGTD
jgi:hypothetical protein